MYPVSSVRIRVPREDLCRVCEVPRASFYDWLGVQGPGPDEATLEEAWLASLTSRQAVTRPSQAVESSETTMSGGNCRQPVLLAQRAVRHSLVCGPYESGAIIRPGTGRGQR